MDLSGRNSGSLGVSSELASFNESTIKDVSDEGVKDGDTLLGDSLFGVNLLQDLVDVSVEGLYSLVRSLLLLVSSSGGGGLCGFLGRSLCHSVKLNLKVS